MVALLAAHSFAQLGISHRRAVEAHGLTAGSSDPVQADDILCGKRICARSSQSSKTAQASSPRDE
jgi:hypothetical protein